MTPFLIGVLKVLLPSLVIVIWFGCYYALSSVGEIVKNSDGTGYKIFAFILGPFITSIIIIFLLPSKILKTLAGK